MEQQEWIDGAFEETDTDYTIAGMNILYKNEKDYLKKGVELLCKKIKPTSVLEFGFGKGWTATEFQSYGIKRHVILEPNKENYQMALDWKDKYSSDIEILNIFSWELETDEKFDLVYDDCYVLNHKRHYEHIDKMLPLKQLYAENARQGIIEPGWFSTDFSRWKEYEWVKKWWKISYYSMFFQIDGISYIQPLYTSESMIDEDESNLYM